MAEPGVVRVRFFAAARAAAGVAEESHAAADLGALLDAVLAARGEGGGRLAQVLTISSLLVDGAPVGTRDAGTVALSGGEVVDVLPPFAGG